MTDHQDIAPPLPDGDVHVGQVLGGRYRLVKKRAERGDIAWWEGVDDNLSRAVTMYVMPPDHPRTEELIAVAKQAGAATDPRFLRVLDVLRSGPADPVSMIVSEEVPGVSLQALLRRGPLPALDAAWVISEVVAALAPLHEAGLSHGELTPTNVMLTMSGAVRIKGFMLFAALAGRLNGDAITRERADVAAVGRLLYACLTGAWPDTTTSDPPRTYGLPPAQWRDDELLSPAKVRPGISPILDAVCIQIIDPRPGAAPLRTAAAISIALRRLLGNVDASADLATRVAAALAPAKEVIIDEDATRRHPMTTGGSDSEPTQPQPREDVTPRRVTKPPDPSPPHPSRLKWLFWVVALVVVIVVIALVVRSCSSSPPPAPAATPEALTVTAVTELDAVADGGDGKDNPTAVPMATDGDKSTCWTSEQYAVGYIPNKKPGIGLILSLGEMHALATLTLTLVNVPAGLSIMIPTDDTVTSPPLDTVGDWTSLDDVTVMESPQTIDMPADTQTQFIMLYFTDLPQSDSRIDRVQAKVCEVEATG